MGRVLVTNESRYDLSSAEAFGAVEFLTGKDFVNIRNSSLNAGVVAELRNGLREFDDDNDWVVIAGSPYISAAVFLILGQMGVQHVPILRWDNRSQQYIPFHLQLNREAGKPATSGA